MFLRGKEMFQNCWPRSLRAFALIVAALAAPSAFAQVQIQPQCTLSASPAMISESEQSVLTATCSPAATSYEWDGGTCSGTSNSSCTVNPSVSTAYSVIGIGSGGASKKAIANVFASWPYDGIYQWDNGYFLSLHRIGGSTLIATIYWQYKSNTVKVGARDVRDANTFDLLAGEIVGSKAIIAGTRFFRACKLSYELDFNGDSSLTVRRTSVANSPGVTTAEVDCPAKFDSPNSVWNAPRIP